MSTRILAKVRLLYGPLRTVFTRRNPQILGWFLAEPNPGKPDQWRLFDEVAEDSNLFWPDTALFVATDVLQTHFEILPNAVETQDPSDVFALTILASVKTYFVKDELAALGGYLDAGRRAWAIPESRFAEARKLVASVELRSNHPIPRNPS